MTQTPAGRSTRGRLPAIARLVFLAVVVISSIGYGARDYYALGRIARDLQPLTMEQRREALFAPWYAEVAAIRAELPVESSIDFVMLTPQARDVAVLAGPLLQPRDVRYFDGWEAWRKRERARFFHDDKATNAIAGSPPGAANVTFTIDPAGTPILRRAR